LSNIRFVVEINLVMMVYFFVFDSSQRRHCQDYRTYHYSRFIFL